MAERKKTKGQTTINKTWHRKLNLYMHFHFRCVTESVCKSKWWLATAPNPDCLLNMDDGPTGLPSMAMTCSFCCVTKECNKHAVPDFTDFYTASRRR
jgi:hypothetical protein